MRCLLIALTSVLTAAVAAPSLLAQQLPPPQPNPFGQQVPVPQLQGEEIAYPSPEEVQSLRDLLMSRGQGNSRGENAPGADGAQPGRRSIWQPPQLPPGQQGRFGRDVERPGGDRFPPAGRPGQGIVPGLDSRRPESGQPKADQRNPRTEANRLQNRRPQERNDRRGPIPELNRPNVSPPSAAATTPQTPTTPSASAETPTPLPAPTSKPTPAGPNDDPADEPNGEAGNDDGDN